MCKFIRNKPCTFHNLPKLLQAFIRLERKAENDYHSILNRLEQIKDMEPILDKLVVTHIDSDNYVDYLFKRAEQLSSHLETYKNIISRIDIGEEIYSAFKQISFNFIQYLKRKIQFKSVWIESMQTIESGRQVIKDKMCKLDELKRTVNNIYESGQFSELEQLKEKFDQEQNNMNELIDDCFQCGQHSKEMSNSLYDQLTQLELSFQQVVRDSMNKISQIKRAPLGADRKTPKPIE